MHVSPLAHALAVVCSARGRTSLDLLTPWLEGECARAAREVPDPAPVHPALPGQDLGELHTSWLTEPLRQLPPGCRTFLLGLMQPEMARFAAMALESIASEHVHTCACVAPSGLSARSLARASMMPPAGRPAGFPALRPSAVRVHDDASEALVRTVFENWPDIAGPASLRLREAMGEGSEPAARRLTALAAATAAHMHEGGSIARSLPRRPGLAFMQARNRFWRALDPPRAEALHEMLEEER